jgi:hypothetical protein
MVRGQGIWLFGRLAAGAHAVHIWQVHFQTPTLRAELFCHPLSDALNTTPPTLSGTMDLTRPFI